MPWNELHGRPQFLIKNMCRSKVFGFFYTGGEDYIPVARDAAKDVVSTGVFGRYSEPYSQMLAEGF